MPAAKILQGSSSLYLVFCDLFDILSRGSQGPTFWKQKLFTSKSYLQATNFPIRID
jgi:hypothetical protein